MADGAPNTTPTTTGESQRQPNYHVPALEKGLDLLELLATSGRPRTLADMARSLNRTSSELFRMVGTLEKREYIVRDEATGAYRLSMKLFELAHLHSPVEQIVRAARRPMRELSDSVEESCHLVVLRHGRLVVVAEEESPARVHLSVELGSNAPLLRTVSGRLLLAHLPPDERAYYLDNDPDYASLTRKKLLLLEQEFEEIKKNGFVIAESNYRVGTDIAVIAGVAEIGVLASLSIPCLAGGVNQGKELELLGSMQQAASRIERNLRLWKPYETDPT